MLQGSRETNREMAQAVGEAGKASPTTEGKRAQGQAVNVPPRTMALGPKATHEKGQICGGVQKAVWQSLRGKDQQQSSTPWRSASGTDSHPETSRGESQMGNIGGGDLKLSLAMVQGNSKLAGKTIIDLERGNPAKRRRFRSGTPRGWGRDWTRGWGDSAPRKLLTEEKNCNQ